jgi:CubicO group peptidase (beta-lactamase class C family)
MQRNIKAYLLFFLSAIFIGNAANAQQNKAAEIDSLMHRANRLGLFNGNILVADNNKVIYKAAIGFTDASKQTRLTVQYRFHIGSIAKEFDAVGIMILKEQGKLNLDDKVAKYFPQLPAWANKITIMNLLQYTSGLPDVKWNTVKTDADNFEDLKKIEKLDFEPGSNYAYNNNNVFLRRRIIEKITGLSFKQFVEQKELKPCGMSTALVDPTESDLLVAKAYNNDGKQDAMFYPISGWTAVTLADFYKWAQFIENFKLITPESTRQISTPFAPNNQTGLGMGSMDGNKLVNHIHDGSSLNYQALMVTYLPKGRTIILMSNNKQGNVYSFNTAIQAILDGKPYAEPKKPILATFHKQFDTMTGEQLIVFYKDLKVKHPLEYGFNDETTLNEIGYYLMGDKRLADAIIVFEYNTILFPASGNVFDSLGEAYYNQGNKQKALLNYRRSVQLDPTNNSAKDIIAKLEQ